MSFRNSRSTKTTPRRSSSLRNNSNNTAPGLASYNRPRSFSFAPTQKNLNYTNYSSTSNPTTSNFHTFIGATNPKNYNNYNTYNSYNPYSKTNYSTNGYNGYTNNYSSYGGSTSGYGSLSVPSTALTALNIMPYSTKSYDKSSRDFLQTVNNPYSNSTVSSNSTSTGNSDKGRKGRQMNRNGSFARSRSASAIRDGSRSVSMTSLNSEGYVVRFFIF